MTKSIEANLSAKGLKFSIVASRFNDFITARLVSGAVDCLLRHGADEGGVTIVRVPGSFEIAQVVHRVASARKHDAVIALGVLIRGETPHFDVISSEITRALSQTAIDTGVPVAFGIVTAESADQAIDRAGGKMGNRGFDAAMSAIEMANLGRELG